MHLWSNATSQSLSGHTVKQTLTGVRILICHSEIPYGAGKSWSRRESGGKRRAQAASQPANRGMTLADIESKTEPTKQFNKKPRMAFPWAQRKPQKSESASEASGNLTLNRARKMSSLTLTQTQRVVAPQDSGRALETAGTQGHPVMWCWGLLLARANLQQVSCGQE